VVGRLAPRPPFAIKVKREPATKEVHVKTQVSLLLLAQLATTGCACLGGSAYQPFPGQTVRSMATVAASPGARSAARAQSEAGYRNPQTAFCLACLIAGGGHFYTGETVKGAALLGVAAAGLIGGAALSSSGDYDDCEYDPETFECEPGAGIRFRVSW
jgi:hypothetical protein